MHKKRILVCGTGFGKIYLKTIVENENTNLLELLVKVVIERKK